MLKRDDGQSGSATLPDAGIEDATSSEVSDRETGAGRRLASNIVALYILQGLNYIIPMAVLPYLVRVLGLEMYGLVAFAQSFAQYFSLLTDYGFNLSATRSIAQQNGDQERISRIFCSVMLIKLLLTLIGAAFLVVIVGSIGRFHQSSAIFLAAYIGVIGGVLFPTWFFQGIEQMRYISTIVGIFRLVGAGALFVFVHHPSDALLSVLIQSSALLAGGAAGLWVAFRKFNLRIVPPTVADLKIALADGWHLFVSTAAVSLYTNTNVFLVGLLAGNIQAGYFSVAEKLIRAMQGLLGPITQAIFPRMNSLLAESRDLALRFAARTLHWMGSISLVSSILIFALAGPVASLLFGKVALGAVPVIRWIAPLPFLVAISNVLGIQIMVPLGFDKQFSRILILAGLFNLALCVPLVHLFAARGAGASVLCTETLVTVLMIFVLRRHNDLLVIPARNSA
jgi:polysaccharide transporter, PST family